eukprot:TRINITY_DN3691_c3_g1_i4.p1 TRINITY_DN3691_c3_g1~~TRINITY_DN3691_c3_g1_i4.p1  ORF type:complete len:342 (-),score=59.70 TRINITY_DN3691_c3_g1_i4:204-1229(-)
MDNLTRLEQIILIQYANESVFKKTRFRRALMYNQRSELIIGARVLYYSLAHQADRPHFKDIVVEKEDVYNNWFRISLLHFWLVTVRLRKLNDYRLEKIITTELFDCFWEDVEGNLMLALETSNPLLISKYSKKMYSRYIGGMIALDNGMIEGDTYLAETIWRNIFQCSGDVPLTQIDKFVEYIRREQHHLEQLSNYQLIRGKLEWGEPPFEKPEGSVDITHDEAYSSFAQSRNNEILIKHHKLLETSYEISNFDTRNKLLRGACSDNNIDLTGASHIIFRRLIRDRKRNKLTEQQIEEVVEKCLKAPEFDHIPYSDRKELVLDAINKVYHQAPAKEVESSE